jgi:hypothetical protein
MRLMMSLQVSPREAGVRAVCSCICTMWHMRAVTSCICTISQLYRVVLVAL